MKTWILLGMMFVTDVFAYTRPEGAGHVANNLLEAVAFTSDFIYTGCMVIGSSFIFASIVKFKEHRRNPVVVPLSTVIFLLIAGLVLLALPFAYLLANHGTPYTLMKK